jgi:uncharacterized protein
VTASIVSDPTEVRRIAAGVQRVAILGIKTEAQVGQPAFYVPAYLVAAGVEVVPVPTYYPEVTTILGKPVVRRVVDAGAPLDAVVVFRRSADVAAHVPDLVAAAPKVVWMQLGIRDDEAAARLTAAGIDVVMDRCIMVEHRAGRGR